MSGQVPPRPRIYKPRLAAQSRSLFMSMTSEGVNLEVHRVNVARGDVRARDSRRGHISEAKVVRGEDVCDLSGG